MTGGILRLQHVELEVPDLELCTAYYTEVLGLVETARDVRDGAGRVFLKCWDEHEHHSVVLREAPRPGLHHLAFKVVGVADLDRCTERLRAAGLAAERHAARELGPGWGEAVRFTAPSGHLIELVHGMARVGSALPSTDPPPRPPDLLGVAPPRLDHVLVTAEDVDAFTDLFTDVLEFRLTEQILADDGHRIAAFLERSHTPHDVGVVTGPNGALHHLAFWTDDGNGVRDAADLLAHHGVPIDVTPTRHGVTRAWTTYTTDPAGHRNEVFTGGYRVDPDVEPITWTEQEMGRAVFYHRGQVDERFFSVHP